MGLRTNAVSVLICLATSLASSDAAADTTIASPVVAVDRPKSLSDLDCAKLDVDTTRLQRALITPGQSDPAATMAEAFPGGVPIDKIKKGQEVDPASLCHYASYNASLPITGRNRVIFIGDSITEGWALAAPKLFPEHALDRGISGQNSSQLLARFRQDVVDLHPSVVHIMIGLNDINTPSGTVLTRDNISSMVDIAEANNIRVVLASITPSDHFWPLPGLMPAQEIRSINAWLKALSRARGIEFVDYYSALASKSGGFRDGLSNEGMHPNARGYALMTPIALKAISETLRRSRMQPRSGVSPM